jgi:hypothetical protein
VRRLLPLLALSLLLCACGSDPEGTGSGSDPSPSGDGAAAGGISQAENDLQVEVDAGDGTAPQVWTLTCVGFVEGSHPQAQQACEHLQQLTDPFAPVPADAMCTEQYGGPQTAHVIGRWGGAEVDLELSRVDGCRIAQWDALVPLVPVVEGAVVPGEAPIS